MESELDPLPTGTASRTWRCRGESRSRCWSGARAAATRCSPDPPTSSSTSAPQVTSDIPPARTASWTPTEAALVTGPGTPITERFSLPAQLAVFSEPLRDAASTTTVPRVSAAMSRLRARNRTLCGAAPGGASETTRPSRPRWRSSSACACG